MTSNRLVNKDIYQAEDSEQAWIEKPLDLKILTKD